MPGERERELVACDPDAVVHDADQPRAAALDLDADRARTRVERVLDELLDDGGRPLDDLAGGDLIDELGRKDLDGQRRALKCLRAPERATRASVPECGGARARASDQPCGIVRTCPTRTESVLRLFERRKLVVLTR